MATTYAEKLRKPEWQKKRLEILQRDDFACLHCQSTTKTLHVHHNTYTYGNDPWDYHNNNFKTLCIPCHELEEHYRQATLSVIHDLLTMGFNYQHLHDKLMELAHEE